MHFESMNRFFSGETKPIFVSDIAARMRFVWLLQVNSFDFFFFLNAILPKKVFGFCWFLAVSGMLSYSVIAYGRCMQF